MIEYDTMNVKRWKDEIDTLLVFVSPHYMIIEAFIDTTCC